jgi:hypothetical protein
LVPRPGWEGGGGFFDRTRRSHIITPRAGGAPGDRGERWARPAPVTGRERASPNGCSTTSCTETILVSRYRPPPPIPSRGSPQRRFKAAAPLPEPPSSLPGRGPPPYSSSSPLCLPTTAAVTSCTRRRCRLPPWSTASRRLIQPITASPHSLASAKAAACCRRCRPR